ncbi:MAG: Xaa-Pro peptidase family protein [Candidatus Peregrinibacteria bacterium]
MERIRKLQGVLRQKGLGAFLVTHPYNVRYLCSFAGTNGALLVTAEKAVLMTDFRYLRSARKQVPKGVSIFNQKQGISKLLGRLKVLGFEEHHMTYARVSSLKKQLPSVRLKPTGGLVEELRMIKEESEVKLIRKACRMTDECLRRLVGKIKFGVSEDELTWELLKIARELGADGFSFPPIICFGKNTADVHHVKEPNKLKRGESVLIDFGIEYKGYATDMTRVFYTRKPTSVEQKLYSTVWEANQAAIAAIAVGKKASEVDQAARDVIKKARYGRYFGHSTGHGVGLEVHEAPTVGAKGEALIAPGMVFTIEPGIYLNRLGGVRIEDMVYVNPQGKVEVLTTFPKKLIILKV